jgi:hypothetical protein
MKKRYSRNVIAETFYHRDYSTTVSNVKGRCKIAGLGWWYFAQVSHDLRMPDREADGTATWSLLTLRSASDGLPHVSSATIRAALLVAGWTWQHTHSWSEMGTALRQRKAGPVTVVDPDAEAKNLD